MCTPPLVSNGSDCVNKPLLGEACNNENNNGCRDDYLTCDDNICKSKGVIGEAPLIGAGTCHDDGETTIIANKCSYVSSSGGVCDAGEGDTDCEADLLHREHLHPKEDIGGCAENNNDFCSGIDARLTCVNNECVPKGDT